MWKCITEAGSILSKLGHSWPSAENALPGIVQHPQQLQNFECDILYGVQPLPTFHDSSSPCHQISNSALEVGVLMWFSW